MQHTDLDEFHSNSNYFTIITLNFLESGHGILAMCKDFFTFDCWHEVVNVQNSAFISSKVQLTFQSNQDLRLGIVE